MAYTELEIDWLDEIIRPAIKQVYSDPSDKDLFERGLHERTLVSCIYFNIRNLMSEKAKIIPFLKNLDVDLEYNRNLKHPKGVFFGCENCSTPCVNNAKAIKRHSFPDLVIHQRNTNNENQVIIEFKKYDCYSNKKLENDKAKLIYFTCPTPSTLGIDKYNYSVGLFVDLLQYNFNFEVYKNGKSVNQVDNAI